MSLKRKSLITKLFIKLFALSAILLGAFSISLAGSGPNMKDGLWEITTKVEMPGMPMKMPSMTHTQCITSENAVPDSSQPGQECKIFENHVDGDTVTWRMECDTPEGKASANGKIVYSGETFKGTIEMSMQGMKMLQQMSGRRIGECNQ